MFLVTLQQNCLILQAGGPSNLLIDLAANEKAVHVDFFNGSITLLLFDVNVIEYIYKCINLLKIFSSFRF